MLRRKVQPQIEEWIKTGKDALLITEARQTGKTYIIRESLKNNGDFIELNFLERPELIELFKTAKSTNDLLMRISVAAERELNPGETFIFLDEIQKYPDIVTWIKFLVEEGSYRYILSGSLLGIELKDIRSIPVGYLQIIDMYPMNFKEFLIAIGFQHDTIQYITRNFLMPSTCI